MIYLQKSELESLSYCQDDKNVMRFTSGEVGRIRILNHYLKHLQDEGKFPEDKESFRFNSVSRTDCNNFRFHPTNMSLISSTGDLTIAPPPSFLSPSTAPSTATCTPAEHFKKSIKRDASLFKTFSDGKFWDNWRRNTLATARAQDIEVVLDLTQTPSTNEDKDLFKEKQKFMCSVFSTTLLTDAGKKYVREHELDFDAQSVYEKLSTYCTNSTSARMNASDTLSYITSAKIDAWKGNSESFIINWQD